MPKANFKELAIFEAVFDKSSHKLLPRYTRMWGSQSPEMHGLNDDIVDPFSDWTGDNPTSQQLLQVLKSLDASSTRDCLMHEE